MSRNTLCSADAHFSLPVDVLCVIFDMLKSLDGRPLHDSSSTFVQSLRWIHETLHVSRFWRKTALSASFLWADIIVTASTPWALEFAHRSRKAPIRISTHLPYTIPKIRRDSKFSECTKSLLHENKERIRELSLEVENLVNNVFLDETAFSGPAFAILEGLQIRHHDRSSFFLTNETLRAPKLKRLFLVNCSVKGDFGSYHNLSHLSIIGPKVSPLPTAIFLSKALLEMANLEKLNLLEWPFELFPTSTIDFETEVATLPKLREVAFQGWPIEWVISVLRLIRCGPQRDLWATVIRANRLEQVVRLFACIMSHAKESSSITHMILGFDPMKKVIAHLWREGVTCAVINLTVSLHPQLGVPQQGLGPTLHLLDGCCAG